MDSAAARSRDHGDRITPTDVVEPAASPADPKAIGEDGLSRRDHDILAFERQWWKYAGSKESAIKELFDMSFECPYANHCFEHLHLFFDL